MRSIIIVATALALLSAFLVYRQTAGVYVPLPHENPGAFRSYWEKETLHAGYKAAFERIKKDYADEAPSDQHFAVHILGEIIYERLGINGISECDAVYGFGCHHGFLARIVAEEGVSVIRKLDDACIEVFGSTLATGCQHGIGHGALDLAQWDVERALALCENTTEIVPILGCMSGVFMEYFNPQNTGIPGKDAPAAPLLDMERPFDICLTMGEKYRRSCYFEMPVWWLGRTEHNFVVAGSLCEQAPDAVAREYCYMGFGNIAGPMRNFSKSDALKVCDQMPSPQGRALCTAGVYWSFIADENYQNDAAGICEHLPSEDVITCKQKGNITCYYEGKCDRIYNL